MALFFYQIGCAPTQVHLENNRLFAHCMSLMEISLRTDVIGISEKTVAERIQEGRLSLLCD